MATRTKTVKQIKDALLGIERHPDRKVKRRISGITYYYGKASYLGEFCKRLTLLGVKFVYVDRGVKANPAIEGQVITYRNTLLDFESYGTIFTVFFPHDGKNYFSVSIDIE